MDPDLALDELELMIAFLNIFDVKQPQLLSKLSTGRIELILLSMLNNVSALGFLDAFLIEE